MAEEANILYLHIYSRDGLSCIQQKVRLLQCVLNIVVIFIVPNIYIV